MAYDLSLQGYPMAQAIQQAALQKQAEEKQQQEQQQQNFNPFQMLQNAKRGYDITNYFRGGQGIPSPGLFSGLAFNGAGWGTAGGGAAADAGVMPTIGGLSNAPTSGGFFSSLFGGGSGGGLFGGSGSGGGLSGFMAGPWAGLGGLAGLGLAAYLGYQHGSAQGKKYREAEKTPEFQASKSFVDTHPDALTTEGVDPSVKLPATIPMAGWGQGTTWNPVKRRYEINGMSFPEYQAYQDKLHQNESPD